MKSYKKHITGLKGVACFMVMVGHYIGLYKYAERFPTIATMDSFLQSPINFALDETFWVKLFFVVSGYLVAMSYVGTFKQFINKSVTRILRLGLPILFASLVIYTGYLTIDFHTADTVNLFANEWLQGSYSGNMGITDVIFSSINVLFLGEVGLNSPYWVLREMLLGSMLIYTLTYIKNRWANKKNLLLVLVGFALLASFVFSDVVFVTILGMCLQWFEVNCENIVKQSWFPVIMIITTLLIYVSRPTCALLFFCALIVVVPKIKILNSIFTSKIAEFFGKISFGIYSFHWPVFCSAGMLILLEVYEKTNLIIACVLSGVCSIIITIILGIIYSATLEKFAMYLVKKISNVINKN